MLADNIHLLAKIIASGQRLQVLRVFEWDPKQEIILLSKIPLNHLKFRIVRYIQLTWIFIIMYQCFFLEIPKGDIERGYLVSKGFQGFFFIANSMFVVQFHMIAAHGSKLVLYINGHLQFHRLYQKGKHKIEMKERNIIEKFTLLLAHMIYWTCHICPFTVAYGNHWMNPCMATCVGYWLLDECNVGFKEEDYGMWNLIAKIILLSLNYYVMYASVAICCFAFAIVFSLSVLSIRDALRTFCEHNLNKIEIGNSAVMYRHVQLLASLLNIIQQNSSVLIYTHWCVFFFGVLLYMILRLSWTMDNAFALITFTLALLDVYVIIIAGVTCLASIHSESEDVYKKLETNYCSVLKRNGSRSKFELRWRRKFYNSFRAIKMKVGPTNFVEVGTPLVLLDAGIGITVDLLLLDV
ncbi:unnamed protein product [Orchesella dallaii]|uniref:Gustatory receptor n=1 Tax=Orchesella dallaii TaxID=48710 RepID=A0ABP1RP66_9HEXA